MHKLHRFLANPPIPHKYATEADRVDDNVSDEFEKWLFQDQTLFTWFLSTLSESVVITKVDTSLSVSEEVSVLQSFLHQSFA